MEIFIMIINTVAILTIISLLWGIFKPIPYLQLSGKKYEMKKSKKKSYGPIIFILIVQIVYTNILFYMFKDDPINMVSIIAFALSLIFIILRFSPNIMYQIIRIEFLLHGYNSFMHSRSNELIFFHETFDAMAEKITYDEFKSLENREVIIWIKNIIIQRIENKSDPSDIKYALLQGPIPEEADVLIYSKDDLLSTLRLIQQNIFEEGPMHKDYEKAINAIESDYAELKVN
jgi:hypothetical protein